MTNSLIKTKQVVLKVKGSAYATYHKSDYDPEINVGDCMQEYSEQEANKELKEKIHNRTDILNGYPGFPEEYVLLIQKIKHKSPHVFAQISMIKDPTVLMNWSTLDFMCATDIELMEDLDALKMAVKLSHGSKLV